MHRSARGVLLLFDFATAALLAAFIAFAFPRPAFAYVDPSVMTYTIQAIAGVAVALAAVAGVALRRTRRWLVKVLGIDENAHKEVEGQVHRTAEASPSVAGAHARSKAGAHHASANTVLNDASPVVNAPAESGSAKASDTPSQKKVRFGDVYSPKWRSRLLKGLLVSLFVSFTLMVVAHYEIMGGSAGSLLFSLRDVWSLFVLPALAATLVLTLILTVLRGRVFNAVLLVLFSFGLCCYIQALLLNGGMPPADGNTIAWVEYGPQAAISAAVWIVVLIAPWLASHLNFRIAQGAAVALSVALIVVQGVGVVSLFSSDLVKAFNPDIKYLASEYTMTDTGMYTVSPKSNVIVFVLDTYDTTDLETALETTPNLLDGMTGFTWFKDSVGAMIPTRYGVPFLLTGQYPQHGEKFSTFLKERYARSSFITDIANANYTMGLYSDTLGTEYLPDEFVRTNIYDRTINFKQPEIGSGPVVNEAGAYSVLMKCAFYRDMPWLAKPFFWYYTDEVNNAMVDMDRLEYTTNGTPYAMDDARWYANLRNNRLSFESDASQHQGAFRFIHLLGTHYPFNIDEYGRFIGEWQSDVRRQALGSMRMVAEYIRQLKAIGAYDNSTIIITADHGIWYLTPDPIQEPTSPILLVKPAGADSDEPLRVSNAPVCSYDVLPTAIAGIRGAHADKYGRTVYEISESEYRERPYYATISRGEHDYKLYEYTIGWGVSDFSNWKLTGEEWDMQK